MSKFLDVALAAAKDAEAIILKYYDSTGVDSVKKTDGSPVTIADREGEAAIIKRIKESFPDHSILGEETGREEQKSEYRWIIDPIDGTKNFTRGVPLFGTLIALMKGNEVIVGVSSVPVLNDLMYAEKGKGAFANGKPAKVSSVADFSNMYLSSGSQNYFEEIGLLNHVTDVRNHIFQYRMFGDLYAYHLLAQGKIDGVVEASIKIYDVAPVKLIVEEAGGRATEIDGTEMNVDTSTFLATNGHVHQQVIDYFK